MKVILAYPERHKDKGAYQREARKSKKEKEAGGQKKRLE